MSYKKDQKVKLVFYGKLKKLFPENLELSGATVAEVISGLRQFVKGDRPSVQIAGFNTEDSLYEPLDERLQVLHILPELSGSKGGGGFFKVILGAVFIALAFTHLGAVALPSMLGGGLLKATLINMGISLMLGGLLEMLSPTPKFNTSSEDDPEASRYISANQNTTKIGTRIPIAYGLNKLPGHYISFNIDAKDVALT